MSHHIHNFRIDERDPRLAHGNIRPDDNCDICEDRMKLGCEHVKPLVDEEEETRKPPKAGGTARGVNFIRPRWFDRYDPMARVTAAFGWLNELEKMGLAFYQVLERKAKACLCCGKMPPPVPVPKEEKECANFAASWTDKPGRGQPFTVHCCSCGKHKVGAIYREVVE